MLRTVVAAVYGMGCFALTELMLFLVDTAGSGVDVAFGSDVLSNDNPDDDEYGRQLLITTGVAFILLQLGIKLPMMWKKSKGGRGWHLMCTMFNEQNIFMIEDATTVMVWWKTGLYDNTDPAQQANLYLTVASALISLVGLWVGCANVVRNAEGGDAQVLNLFMFGLPVLVLSGFLIFWLYVALHVINHGDSWAKYTGLTAECTQVGGYIRREVGNCGSYSVIETARDCRTAASSLGMRWDWTVSTNFDNSSSSFPYGCYTAPTSTVLPQAYLTVATDYLYFNDFGDRNHNYTDDRVSVCACISEHYPRLDAAIDGILIAGYCFAAVVTTINVYAIFSEED